MTLERYGIARAGGGCLFVLSGAAPNRMVSWTLTGNGTLTAIDSYTDAGGVATAKWDGTGAAQNDVISVEASQHA